MKIINLFEKVSDSKVFSKKITEYSDFINLNIKTFFEN